MDIQKVDTLGDNRCVTVKQHEHQLIWKSCWTPQSLYFDKCKEQK